MSRPADLPRRTSATAELETLQQRVQRRSQQARVPSAALTQFAAATGVRLRRFPRRFALHVFVGFSIPAALIAGTVLPLAQPAATNVQPVAAAYAVQGGLNAQPLDLPMEEDEAALAFPNADSTSATVDQVLGHPVASPVQIGSITENNVNLRRGPGTDQAVIAKLPAGTKLEVIGQRDGWYRVATARGTVGWVVGNYFTLGTASRPATTTSRGPILASVGVARVNLRKGPGTNYGSYGRMAQGVSLQVLARNGAWFKVQSPRGTVGWVLGELLAISADAARAVPVTNEAPPAPQPVVAAKPVPVGAAPAATSGDAAAIARQFVGARYVWGGASPSGFDCSGLTLYVYKQLGLKLPHKASMQYNTPGQRIGNLNALQPGDLVFFVRTTSAAGITHVGIYTGNGMMVTAGTPRTGVQQVSVHSQYWASRFAGGVRPYR